DHGRVGGVLAGGVAVLLHRGDGVLQQQGLPGGQVGGSPVPVDALDGGGAVHGDLRHHVPQGGAGRVVRVNEHRQAQIHFLRHYRPSRLPTISSTWRSCSTVLTPSISSGVQVGQAPT